MSDRYEDIPQLHVLITRYRHQQHQTLPCRRQQLLTDNSVGYVPRCNAHRRTAFGRTLNGGVSYDPATPSSAAGSCTHVGQRWTSGGQHDWSCLQHASLSLCDVGAASSGYVWTVWWEDDGGKTVGDAWRAAECQACDRHNHLHFES